MERKTSGRDGWLTEFRQPFIGNGSRSSVAGLVTDIVGWFWLSLSCFSHFAGDGGRRRVPDPLYLSCDEARHNMGDDFYNEQRYEIRKRGVLPDAPLP